MRLPRESICVFLSIFSPSSNIYFLLLPYITTNSNTRRTIVVHFNKSKLFLKSNLFLKNTKKRFLYCNFLQLRYAKYNGMKITIATKIKAKIDSRITFCGLVQRSLLAVVSKYTAKSTIMTNSLRQNII